MKSKCAKIDFEAAKKTKMMTTTTTTHVEKLSLSSKKARKMFGVKPLTELPANLRNVFVVQYKAEPLNTFMLSLGFIDFDAFFQSALVLHEDVLEPFLAKLKHHIKSIHVCLGEIESWLLEPKSNIEFLEETFELELELLGNGDLENDSDERVQMIHVGHAIVDMTLTHLSTISAVATD